MKIAFLILFAGSMLSAQAQNTIKTSGSWCDADMKLSVELNDDSNVMFWYFNGEKLTEETNLSIDCQKYGAGTYKVEIAENYDIVSSSFELSGDDIPEIDFSVASYPAAAVTILDGVTVEGEDVASLIWDFGNGESTTSSKAQVFYKTEQEYTITLTVTTVSGCTYTASKKHNWSIN